MYAGVRGGHSGPLVAEYLVTEEKKSVSGEKGPAGPAFHIGQGSGVADKYVDAAFRAWLEHYPQEVKDFIEDMDRQRESVNLCNRSGAVKGVNEKGEHQFDIPLIIPLTMDALFQHIFGRDYLRDKQIYERIKKVFKIGRLNANFHQPAGT